MPTRPGWTGLTVRVVRFETTPSAREWRCLLRDLGEIREEAPRLQEGVPLRELCRFGVGGAADYLVEAAAPGEILGAWRRARREGLPFLILGAGTNLFFADRGFRGVVVRLVQGDFRLDPEAGLVRAWAGFPLERLVRGLARRGFGGLEFLGNIPGSAGGAVVGNAGCYGHATAEVLAEAVLLDLDAGRALAALPEELGFAYRHSRLKEVGNLVVYEAAFRVTPRPEGEVLVQVEEELARRRRRHPHEASCAGSFFKNPSGRPAWEAIKAAGLAGARVGGAALSPMHANFLINAGGATAADILELARRIQREVRERLGVRLEPEVRYAGERGLEEVGEP